MHRSETTAVRSATGRRSASALAKKAKKKVAAKAAKPTKSSSAKAKEKVKAKGAPAEKARKIAAPPAARPNLALEVFADTTKAFQRRDWAKTRDLCERFLAEFPDELEIRDRVRAYHGISLKELTTKSFSPKTAEDHYQVGVMRLNQGSFEEAIKHFDKTSELEPRGDRASYARAAAFALGGDTATALKNLRAAIERNPDNRIFAANDSDFGVLRDEPEFLRLIARPD